MKNLAVYYFATRGDLSSSIRSFERIVRPRYTVTCLSRTHSINYYDSAFEIPGFGYSHHGDHTLDPSYLIVPPSVDVNAREVPQRDGTVLYAVDSRLNPMAVTWRIGGIHAESRCLIRGCLSADVDNDTARSLYGKFSEVVLSRFKASGRNRISAEAKQLWREGYRLTASKSWSSDVDLQIE